MVGVNNVIYARDTLPILFKPKNLNCHVYAKYEVYLALHQAENLYEVYSLLKFAV